MQTGVGVVHVLTAFRSFNHATNEAARFGHWAEKKFELCEKGRTRDIWVRTFTGLAFALYRGFNPHSEVRKIFLVLEISQCSRVEDQQSHSNYFVSLVRV
jgi:hypothetical protein